MTTRYPQWSGPAARLADAVDTAVRAALDHDADAFAAALLALRRGDPDMLSTLLGTMTQDLLERRYADGMDSDDAARLIDSCAAPWWPHHDAGLVAIALVAALGVHDPAETPDADPQLVVAHGLLLVAVLLPSERELSATVHAAMQELHRAQTVEMP